MANLLEIPREFDHPDEINPPDITDEKKFKRIRVRRINKKAWEKNRMKILDEMINIVRQENLSIRAVSRRFFPDGENFRRKMHRLIIKDIHDEQLIKEKLEDLAGDQNRVVEETRLLLEFKLNPEKTLCREENKLVAEKLTDKHIQLMKETTEGIIKFTLDNNLSIKQLDELKYSDGRSFREKLIDLVDRIYGDNIDELDKKISEWSNSENRVIEELCLLLKLKKQYLEFVLDKNFSKRSNNEK